MSQSLEAQLWAAANQMRGAVPPTDYMKVCLGLVFLRYLSAAFEAKHAQLSAEEFADPEDPEEYLADNIYWVPEEARWSKLAASARSSDIGQQIDNAMRTLERENSNLQGVLPKEYGAAHYSPTMLGGLVDHFTNLSLASDDADLLSGADGANQPKDDFDVLGRIYEFFLGEFAAMQGKTGGEQYTPRGIVDTLVHMIEPLNGRIYDPCCGTGGFFIQSRKFLQSHQGRIGDVAVYGQERNPETYRMALMNLAIRGIGAKVSWNNEGTLLKDAFPDTRFDYILANPPFNISEWSGDLLRDDARWKFGIPPEGNANFAWMQHIHHHLSPTGYAAVVMANGSMSSTAGGEDDIRKAMVEADAVDCVISMPGQLFFGVQIPVCVWIFTKAKSGSNQNGRKHRDRSGEFLFLDARKLGHMVTRKQRVLSPEDIQKLAGTYHAWRDGEGYEDVPGFSKSASLEEVSKNDFILTPGRYVGSEAEEDDGIPFETKMTGLSQTLYSQVEESAKLDEVIRKNLEGLGYGK